MDIAELGLVVRSDGVVIAGKRLKDFRKDASDTDRAVGFLNGTFTKLASLAGVVAGSFLAKSLIDYSSAWSDLAGRVDLATGSMGHAPEVMGRLEAMARRTYSSLTNTADSYLSNANALKDLGLSTNQALDFTESLNNAMVVSGAKAQQAASVQNALSKAMGLGKLAGEDLNTILSSGGRIAQLLAEELGTTTLGLRAMGAEGKITSEVIQRTLLGNLEKLREEADSMAATMLDGFQLIGNSLFAFVGRVDQAVGAGENMATMFVGIADAISASTEPAIAGINILIDNIPKLLSYATAFALFWAGPYVAAMASAALTTASLSGALVVLRGALIRTGVGALIVLAGELIFYLGELASKSTAWGDAMSSAGNVIGGIFTTMMLSMEALQTSFTAAALWIQAAFIGAFASIYEKYAQLVNLIGTGLNMLGVTNTVNMDPTWATGVYNDIATQAALAGEEAALRWAKAFGGRVPELVDVDGIIGGLTTKTFDSVDEMFASMSAGGLDTPGTPPVSGGAGGGAAAKLNEYQQLTKSIREQTEALGWEAQALGMSNMEADKFNTTMELLRAAKEAGIPITGKLTEEVNSLANAYATAAERSRTMQRDMQMIDQLNSAIASGFADVFTSILDGSKTAGEAIGDLLSQLGKLLINQAFNMLFNVGGGGGGLLGSLFSFDGGGKTPSGPRTGGVDGKGGFLSILHPDETVIDHTKGGPANDNSGGGSLTIQINGSNLTQQQMTRAIADAIAEHDSGLARKVENKVRVMQTDPRAADGSW